MIISSMLRCRCNLPYSFHGGSSLLHIPHPVEGGSQIVVGSHRHGVLHKGLPVAYVSFLEVLLAEVTVSLTHISPVNLCVSCRAGGQ